MEHDEAGEPRWEDDLEARAGRNIRSLREARGISQQQLGTDLLMHGVPMHQTTVAKLEAGRKPLRVNEAAAIAAYFGVPVESLWQHEVNEHELAALVRRLQQVEAAIDAAQMTADQATEVLAKQRAALHEAEAERQDAVRRMHVLGADRERLLRQLEGVRRGEHR